MMKYVLLALAFAASLSAFETTDEELGVARFLTFNTNMTTTTPDIRGIAAFGLLIILFFAVVRLGSSVLSAYERSQGYDYGYDYYGYDQQYEQDPYQQETFAARYGVSNLATKMTQLEKAFKKFEVATEECQMFVACEAAQLHKLKQNVPVVQIINRILSTPGDNTKVNQRVLAAFQLGQKAHQKNVPNACAELREGCYVAHNNQ